MLRQSKRAVFAQLGAMFLALGTIALVSGCTPADPDSPAAASDTVSATETATGAGPVNASQWGSLDELFADVDDHFGCPEDASGPYAFFTESSPLGLEGRQCGVGLVLAWAEDSVAMDETMDMVLDAEGEVTLVDGEHWFVADLAETLPAESGATSVPEAELADYADRTGSQLRTSK